MKTENQIRERIAGLEGYIAKLKALFAEYISNGEDGTCFAGEICRCYKEIHALVWVLE